MKSNRSEVVVGFDLDGTIIDHSANKVRLAREYGFDLIPEQTPSGVFGRFLPPEAAEEIKARLYTDLETGLKSELMPGAKTTLEHLHASGQLYFLLTRRDPEIGEAVLMHLGLWPGLFDAQNTAFVNDMAAKAPYAKQWKISHYFDDHLSTITGPLSFIDHRFLFDPYGLLPSSSDYAKLGSWNDIWSILA